MKFGATMSFVLLLGGALLIPGTSPLLADESFADLREALRVALPGDDPEAIDRICRALLEENLPAAVAVIVDEALLGGGGGARLVAADLLSRVESPCGVEAVAEQISGKSSDDLLAILACMNSAGRGGDPLELRRLLQHGDWRIRLRTARVLGGLESRKALQDLRALSSSERVWRRRKRSTIWMMQQLGMQQWWSDWGRALYEPGFCDFVDGLIREGEAAE